MKYLAMIQARCGSTRLPGKVLMDLGGKPVLQRVIERVQRSRHVDEAVVVTTVCREDLRILGLCAGLGVRCFAGAELDVLDRFYQMAKLLQPEYVIRVTADCPCYDWALLDAAIEAMRPETDYCKDAGETLPDGLDIEIVRFSALEAAWRDARLPSEREHVTLYLANHPERFRFQDFACPIPGLGGLRWTLDEPADYALLQRIVGHFTGTGQEDFLLADVLGLLDAHPDWTGLNDGIQRNEGLARSLAAEQNDKGGVTP